MKIKKQKSRGNSEKLEEIQSLINEKITRRALETSIEVGISSWSNTLPIKKYGLSLDKHSFWNSLYIRYIFPIKRVSSLCVSGTAFKLEHALLCPKGGFMSIKHNEVRQVTVALLSECCKDVSTELVLQQPTGESLPILAIQYNEVCVDVAASGSWVKGQVANVDVKVFDHAAKVCLIEFLNTTH